MASTADRYAAEFRAFDALSPIVKDSQGNLEPGLNLQGYDAIATTTQTASLSTAVALNGVKTKVTLFSAIGAGAQATFTYGNNRILSSSAHVQVTVQAVSAVNSIPATVSYTTLAAGSCIITVRNNDGAQATSAAPVLHITVSN